MKKNILLIMCLLFCYSIYSGCSKQIPLNEQPMYGGEAPTAEEQKIHDQFIKEAIADSGSREAAIRSMLDLAHKHYHKGELDIAMRRFNQAWLLDQKNYDVYFGFARILDKNNKLKDAINMYSKAIKIDSKRIDAWHNRALDYYHVGKYGEAISDLTNAVKITPNDAKLYHDRASCYIRTNELDRAISDFSKALEIDPNAVRTLNDRAILYFKMKEYDKSWEDVNKAIQLGYNPNPRFIGALKEASGKDR